MSNLRVANLLARLGAGTISLPTGNKLIGVDAGSIAAPGTVVQVQQTVFADTWSSGSNGVSFYPVSPLNTTITPKFQTSKILVMATLNIGSGYWEIQGRFTRSGYAIGVGNTRGSRTRCTFLDNRYEAAGGVRNGWGAVSAQYLDSPGTTSPTTYGVELNGYSTYTLGVNYNPYSDSDSVDYFGAPISTLTLMEIAQ